MLPYLVVFCHSFCVFWELTMFKVDWTIKITDEHLENFEQLGFFFLDDVFENQEFLALQTESGFVDYKDIIKKEKSPPLLYKNRHDCC